MLTGDSFDHLLPGEWELLEGVVVDQFLKQFILGFLIMILLTCYKNVIITFNDMLLF